MQTLKYKYIVIEGNIGAGKTSLAKKLASSFSGKLVLEEFAENPFLAKFYEDPSRFALALELSFLAERYKQLDQIIDNQNGQLIISDYHIRKSLLFAKANLSGAELSLYNSFFDIISSHITEPELLIFLKRDVKQLQENISKRGRDYEKNISDEYLLKIDLGYKKLIENHPFSNVVKIDINNLDFINNEDHYNSIIDLINKV